jgi:uncharacterized protein (UPF0261 family)
MPGKRIAVIGTLDTKGAEHAYVAACLREFGHEPVLIDLGTGGPATVTPDITREEVAAAGGLDLAALVATGDRGICVTAMSEAAPVLVAKLAAEGRLDGVISLGGGGGTALGTAAMRALPVGFPKLMVSTMASGNTAHYVAGKDIVMFPSIVDVSGLNRISRTLFHQAAAAIAGMVDAGAVSVAEDRPLIAASMFGNTTRCVELARALMEAAGHEVLVFHATGTGGRTMETLIGDGLIRGVLDITTTEWADELVGGVLTAGPHRLEAAARTGTPAIVVPGCLDMVNFGARDTVPAQFEVRRFHVHNPQVTLMRTSPEECAGLGRIVAEKVNASTGPVCVLVPTRAISVISAPGQPFHDPAADAALFEALRRHLDPAIPLVEIDAAINDEVFAEACASRLIELIGAQPNP